MYPSCQPTIHQGSVNQREDFAHDVVYHARTQRETFVPPVVKRSANIDNNLSTIRGKIFIISAFNCSYVENKRCLEFF